MADPIDTATRTSSSGEIDRIPSLYWLWGVVFLGIVVDQASKVWAKSTLIGLPASSFLNDTFRLVYAENTGAFLSLGANASAGVRFGFMIVFNALLLIGLWFYLSRAVRISNYERFGFGLILSGGLGNLIDRMFRQGCVIDFMNLGLGNVRTGIFNVADVWISVGVGLLALLWLQPKRFHNVAQNKASQVTTGIAVLLATLFVFSHQAIAETVVYRTGSDTGLTSLQGEILELTSKEMSFRVRTPVTVVSIRMESVVAFSADRNKHHVAARKALAEDRFDEAREHLILASQDSLREWERREVLADLIVVSVNQSHWVRAARIFQDLFRSHPDTRHQELVPLHWVSVELDESSRLWALTELESPDDWMSLVAASWLLPLPKYEEQATTRLDQLRRSQNPLIRQLATCQLWRTQFEKPTGIHPVTLDQWERQRDQLPRGLRGGPNYLLGQGYEKLVMNGVAVSRYLWLDVEKHPDMSLRNRALLKAADLLDQMGQPTEAASVRESIAQTE